MFVADFDATLVGRAANYRFFLFAVLLAGLAIALRSKWGIVGGIAYIVGYPAVAMCWKLPKWLGKARSPVAFLAAANAAVLMLGNIKQSILSLVAVAFCVLVIAASSWAPLLWVAGVVLAVLISRVLYRTIRFSLSPSAFLRVQQRAITRMAESNSLRQLTSPADELLRADVERFTHEQQISFTTSLGNAVLAHRVLYYWAHQLERYRRSAAALISMLCRTCG